ncbi:MAG: TetR/AcrR family transcriptional regulator [Clostridiales Family XIII bacterium]|jgi:AcrR family transcriptional regulator|nr:TetR/AcrR family transcriptional regulator [Clostridiales Family XIII bacterium]
MEGKENRRVALTKRMLKDTLIELLREKDIYHISIRELCERADVNRTTFYKYYGSQFDLLTDMENDIIAFINKTVAKNQANIETTIRVLCEYLENNLEFARLLINNNIDSAFPEKLFSLAVIKESFLKNCFGKYDAAETEYLFNFIIYGAFRIVCMWLNSEKRESPETLSAMIKRIAV